MTVIQEKDLLLAKNTLYLQTLNQMTITASQTKLWTPNQHLYVLSTQGCNLIIPSFIDQSSAFVRLVALRSSGWRPGRDEVCVEFWTWSAQNWFPRRGNRPAALLPEAPFCNSSSWCHPSHLGFGSREGEFLRHRGSCGPPWRLNSRPCTTAGAALSISPSPDAFSDPLCSFGCSQRWHEKKPQRALGRSLRKMLP